MIKQLINLLYKLFPFAKIKKKYKFKPKSSVRYVSFSDSIIKVDLKRYLQTEHGKEALKKLRSKSCQTLIKKMID